MAFSSWNNASDNAFDNSVLPTPVGPRNKNEPIGRFGSFSPTRPLRTAFATAVTASSCPTTLLWSVCSNFCKRTPSDSWSFCTGIFVQSDTTAATSSSVTSGFLPACFFWKRFFVCIIFFWASSFSARIVEASTRSPARIASSIFAS